MNKRFYIDNNPIRDAISSFSNNPQNELFFKKPIFLRKELFETIEESFNTDTKVLTFSGVRGTGKTAIIAEISRFLAPDVRFFYFQFSTITTLDDIVLSLFTFFESSFSNEFSNLRKISDISFQSVDQKLSVYLSNLKTPLIIAFDNIENLDIDSKENYSEITGFIRLLGENTLIKLIIAGAKIPQLKIDQNTVNLRISGIEDDASYNILKNSKIPLSNQIISQLQTVSRGYLLGIELFQGAINNSIVSPFELLMEYTSSKEPFDEFMVQKIFNSLSLENKKIIYLFTMIRHAIPKSAIEKLFNLYSPFASLDYLIEMRLLSCDCDFYNIRTIVRDYALAQTKKDDKLKIHEHLYNFYNAQIPLKPVERAFKLSRKTHHSERYYHFNNSGLKKKELGSLVRFNTAEYPDYTVSKSSAYSYQGTDLLLVSNKNDISPNKQFDDHTVVNTDISCSDLILNNIDDIKLHLTDEELSMLNEQESSEAKFSHSTVNDCLNSADNKDGLVPFEQLSDYDDKPNDEAEMFLAIAENYENEGKYSEAIEHYQKVFEIYQEANDHISALETILYTADAYNFGFKHDLALNYYHRVLNSEYLNENIEVQSLIGMGDIYNYRKDYQSALNSYSKALGICIEYGINDELPELNFKLALVYDDMGNYNNAVKFYLFCTDSKNGDDNEYLASSYFNLGNVFYENGDKVNSCFYYEKSLEIDTKNFNYEGISKTCSRLGLSYFELDNIDKAMFYYQQSLNNAKLTDDSYFIAAAYLEIGDVCYTVKQFKKALKAFILAKKSIGNSSSTDSKDKIDSRIKKIFSVLGKEEFEQMLYEIGHKNFDG
jgi:tetratricopeptide (TPR) repeat protein